MTQEIGTPVAKVTQGEDQPAPDAATLAPPEEPTTAGVVFVEPVDLAPRADVPSMTVVAPPPDYSNAGVPSLDFVRDKIESRYAHSLGSTELAQETPEVRSLQEQAAKREEAAKDRLAEIRRSLHRNSTS